jgi:hypothetical protein
MSIVWLIQKGTHLIQKEVITLEEAGFSFYHNHIQSLFGSQLFSPSNPHVTCMSVHSIMQLTDASFWPITHGGKKVKRPFIFKITQRHTNNWEVGILFTQCNVFPLVDLPSPRYGRIYNILLNDQKYDVIIGNFPRCSCKTLCQNASKFFGCSWGVCAL